MKTLLYVGASIGGLLGGYIPVLLWNADAFGVTSILFGMLGTVAGIIGGYYAGKYFGE